MRPVKKWNVLEFTSIKEMYDNTINQQQLKTNNIMPGLKDLREMQRKHVMVNGILYQENIFN